MLVQTTTVVALRCPLCGKLEFYSLSLFEIAPGNFRRIKCTCGTEILRISTKDRVNFGMRIKCPMCEREHLFHLKRKEIWSAKLLELYCEDTGLEIIFIGSRGDIREGLKKQDRSLVEMVEVLGIAEYFENPDVMYRALEYLYKVAESGNLYCQCGNNHIEIEILPGTVEFHCGQCHCRGAVKAKTEQDLKLIQQIGEIRLTVKGCKIRNIKKTHGFNKHFKKF